MINFKKYYINGNRFTININFRTEMRWNDFMYFLHKKVNMKISDHIYNAMIKNPIKYEDLKMD